MEIVSELTAKFLQDQLSVLEYFPDKNGVIPNKYSLLFHSPVTVNAQMFELVYKFCRSSAEEYVSKLSLLHPAYIDLLKSGRLEKRLLLDPNSHYSENDYNLMEGEVGYRYLRFNTGTLPIEVRSMIEVHPQYRGRGIGSFFFDQYGLLATDFVKRLEVQDKEVKLLVRANSDPVDWTVSRALGAGYTPNNDLGNIFPTYQKTVSAC